MYKLIMIIVLLFSYSVFSQEISNKDDVARFKEEAKQAVLVFFEGFHEGDTSKMKKVMDKNMVMQTIAKTKDGLLKVVPTNTEKFLTAINNRPAEQRWKEQLLDFKIDADMGIAQVWTPYEFYVNDKFSHCGVNVFQLFNDGKTWKIMAIADTRNKKGCK